MLIMSDMSGPSMVPGFETYVTGYSLTDVGFYALAKTWYAPEMDRPGCVWTHTLLIENTDLARIADLTNLTSLFVKPSKNGATWDSYESPLFFSREDLSTTSETLPKRINRTWEVLAGEVLRALYNSPDQPVYVAISNVTDYEALAFAVWSQQWPRLRRNFWFCTGAITNRKAGGRLFDLQMIPRASVNRLEREVVSAVIIDGETDSENTKLPDWVSAAIADLYNPNDISLRSFLRLFGSETIQGRADFLRLTETFLVYKAVSLGKQPLADLINVISKYFPKPHDAARLKNTLFGGSTYKKLLSGPPIPEDELLRELITTEHHSIFDAEALVVRERAKLLIEKNPSLASELAYTLLGADLTPIGDEFLAGIYDSELVTGFSASSKTRRGILPLLLKHKPSIVASLPLWQGDAYEQRELFNLITAHKDLTDAEVDNLVSAMLNAGSDAVTYEIGYKFGTRAVNAVLAWCDGSPVATTLGLSPGWRRVLFNHPYALLRWMEREPPPSVATMALIASLLNPHSADVIGRGANIWVPLADAALDTLDHQTLISTMTFLLALGFNNHSRNASWLVARSFETVHSAAETDLLGPNWRLLDYLAPVLSEWRDWDKCERLRSALVQNFIRFRWPNSHLLKALENPKTLIQVFAQSSNVKQQRKYIVRVVKQVIEGRINITAEQREVLLMHPESRRR